MYVCVPLYAYDLKVQLAETGSFCPSCGHGPITPSIKDQGQGHYLLSNINGLSLFFVFKEYSLSLELIANPCAKSSFLYREATLSKYPVSLFPQIESDSNTPVLMVTSNCLGGLNV